MIPQNLTGKLLVAPPSVLDRRFNNTVIYISSHTASGAWGVVLNKPLEQVSIRSIMDKIGYHVNMEGTIHAGGPVDQTTVHFLHSAEVITHDTIVNEHGICVSGDEQFVDKLLNDQIPEEYRVLIGACTWAPGQLEGELRGEDPWTPEHSWLVAPAIPTVVIGLDGMDQWHAAVDFAARSAVSEWMS